MRDIPKRLRPHRVDRNSYELGTFVGGGVFVRRYGARLILRALWDMVDRWDPESGRGRTWRREIVSPANYLVFLVKELARGEGP